jgi:hypothetical protein
VSPAGWFLQNIIVELVLSQGDWCLSRLVPASIVTVGWFLQDLIKKVLWFSPLLGFHVKYLCIVPLC